MSMLSDDDLNLAAMSDEELERAWELWFDLVQVTNDDDPPFTHGVFAGLSWEELGLPRPRRGGASLSPPPRTG